MNRLTKFIGMPLRSSGVKFIRQLSTGKTPEDHKCLVTTADVTAFCINCAIKAGSKPEHAKMLADVLVIADYWGHYSHGLNRIEYYVKDLTKGLIATEGEPHVDNETHSTARIDGANLLGPVVGAMAMQTAIKKAQSTGIGFVVAHNTNHYGIAGFYGQMAVKQTLIGLSFTNTSPFVLPTRAKQLALGTNPIAFLAPGLGESDTFILDMATSAIAIGKVEVARRKNSTLYPGLAVDKECLPTVDPHKCVGLQPIGGFEETSGYKGFGLGMMVDILCGVLADAKYGTKIKQWGSSSSTANLGQAFMAIDPCAFGAGFRARLSDYIQTTRSLEAMDKSLPVFVPGDPERIHQAEVDREGGIRYPEVLIKSVNRMAESLNVSPLKVY